MSFFTATTGIPASNDNPSVDQPNMQVNNDSFIAIWDVDHYGLNNNAGGNHKQIHLKNIPAPGGLGANADGVMYANAVSANSWPFWQNALGSFQLVGAQSVAANGYINIAGIIIQWGSTTAVASSSSTNVAFPITFPNNVFSVQASVVTNDNSTIRFSILNNATTSGFTTTQTNTSHFTNLYWLAIGN